MGTRLTADEWRRDLRTALTAAMKARDKPATNALRSALGAIDNAEAADETAAPAIEAGRIAGGVAGLGAGEVARRELTSDELVAIVRHEIADRHAAASELEGLGAHDRAALLRGEAAVLQPFVV